MQPVTVQYILGVFSLGVQSLLLETINVFIYCVRVAAMLSSGTHDTVSVPCDSASVSVVCD
jgi:hypothetical protein